MKFIITYGCDGVGTEQLAVEAETIELALQFAYESAKSYREGYEGLHGVLDYSQFCEDEGYDPEDDDIYEVYEQFIENELEYWAEDYNEFNIEHQTILIDCNGKFWEI